MGTLYYGGGRGVSVDDASLACLQIVLTVLLPRDVSFYLNFRDANGGRQAVWIDRRIPLRIHYLGAATATVTSDEVQAMTLQAHSASGIDLDGVHG